MKNVSIYPPLAMFFFLLIVNAAYAQENMPPPPSGRAFLIMMENDRKIGDAFIFGLNSAYAEYIDWVNRCIGEKSSSQMADIFVTWLKEHPEKQNIEAAELYFNALEDTCDH